MAGERQEQKLQRRSFCQKIITKKLLQRSHRRFLSSIIHYSYLMRIQTIWFLLGKFLIHWLIKYNNNWFFFQYVPGILPSVTAPTSEAWSVFKPRAIFAGTDRRQHFLFSSKFLGQSPVMVGLEQEAWLNIISLPTKKIH